MHSQLLPLLPSSAGGLKSPMQTSLPGPLLVHAHVSTHTTPKAASRPGSHSGHSDFSEFIKSISMPHISGKLLSSSSQQHQRLRHLSNRPSFVLTHHTVIYILRQPQPTTFHSHPHLLTLTTHTQTGKPTHRRTLIPLLFPLLGSTRQAASPSRRIRTRLIVHHHTNSYHTSVNRQ